MRPEQISEIAGISRRKGNPSVPDLIKWGHESPLEFSFWIFKVKAPITVFRQLFRHRTGKFMEESLRYCGAKEEYHIPDNVTGLAREIFIKSCQESFDNYRELVEAYGIQNEDARGLLPLNIYSTAYIGFDMRNLRNFFKLRLDKHAQAEIRQVASAMYNFIPNDFKLDIPDEF